MTVPDMCDLQTQQECLDSTRQSYNINQEKDIQSYVDEDDIDGYQYLLNNYNQLKQKENNTPLNIENDKSEMLYQDIKKDIGNYNQNILNELMKYI